MYKLLFDSDALIKCSKAGFLDLAAENFNAIITEEVYGETVNEGRRGFHPDAEKIEKLVKDVKIKIVKSYKKKKLRQDFGRGEISILEAYNKNMLIVTDDLSFTSYIKKENMNSISSAHLIIALIKKGKLQKQEAYRYLGKLKPFIRKEIYELVKKDIGD